MSGQFVVRVFVQIQQFIVLYSNQKLTEFDWIFFHFTAEETISVSQQKDFIISSFFSSSSAHNRDVFFQQQEAGNLIFNSLADSHKEQVPDPQRPELHGSKYFTNNQKRSPI